MGYQLKTTRIFKGRGFLINMFPDEAAKGEARSCFDERISTLQPEWTLVARNEINALMIDAAKNVKIIRLAWGGLDGGPRLIETTADDSCIEFVRIKMSPAHVSKVRDAGVAIFNPDNKELFLMCVAFGGAFGGEMSYVVVREKIPINIKTLERMVAKAQRELIPIRSFCGKKIDQDETVGPRMML